MRPSIVVRLTDENGVQGWGQSVPIETWTYETVESVETTLRHYLAPVILGAEPSDLAGVHERMDRAIRPSFSVGQPLCKAAVDLACYDLWGRQTNRSVSEILGGARQRQIKLSWTVQSADDRRCGGPARARQHAAAMTASTSRSAIRRRRNMIFNLSARCAISRPAAFTGRTRIRATTWKPRSRWRRSSRTPASEALESPLPPNLIRGYQALKRQGALPILMDEGIVSPVEVAEFIALEMIDGIAMKVARCGGLWNASRIVALLRENNLLVFGSGLTDPDLSLAAYGASFRMRPDWTPRPRSTGRSTSRGAARPIRHSAPMAT